MALSELADTVTAGQPRPRPDLPVTASTCFEPQSNNHLFATILTKTVWTRLNVFFEEKPLQRGINDFELS